MLLQNSQADFAELLLSDIQPSDLIKPVENILLYRINMNQHLLKVLSEYYPYISTLLGDDFFKNACLEYIQHYPSRSGNLYDYGKYFPDFLREFEPVHHLPYLYEVSQFEWILHELEFAADHPPLDIHLLNSIAPHDYGRLHFTLNPASYLMQFHYPILKIIDFCKSTPTAMLDLTMSEMNLLFIRQDFDITFITLNNAEFKFLQQLQQGETLSDALAVAIEIDKNFDLEDSLLIWVQDKILVDCQLFPEHFAYD